ncbi:MAG: hypothetical protein L0Y58_19810 [Verrucomicrobia subdivision 3 bacterium]|nr:hypothetical protein [Limisphaerales bacterium]
MNMVQANCRVQFTAEDIEFILNVLRPKVDSRECLVQLLADEESRDLVLDNEALLHAILEHRNCLRISTHFYFYILVRHVFRRSGIDQRKVADYVAEMLSDFSNAEQMQLRAGEHGKPLDYFFEMLSALHAADDTTRFFIRAHIGNHSLFLSGVFPDRIRHRAEFKGAPDLKYYEELGSASYRAARDHRLAFKYDVAEVFDILGERFQTTRRALNDLGERLITIGDVDSAVSLMLKTSLNLGL